MKQVELKELEEAIRKVVNGGDPLDFVNAFFRRPAEAPTFPRDYWEHRICCVAEMLTRVKKIAPVAEKTVPQCSALTTVELICHHGANLETVLTEAAEIAAKLERSVSFSFNGERMAALPDRNPTIEADRLRQEFARRIRYLTAE